MPLLAPNLVASIYLKTGIGGATAYNLNLFRFVGQVTSEHRMPWLIGGDYQMAPRAVEDTLFQQTAGAKILADLSPIGTCDSPSGVSTIDFFIASDDLASTGQRATVYRDPAIAIHRPVRMTLPTDAGKMKKQVVRTTQRLPNNPVYGPRPPPPDWTEARRAALRAVSIAAACRTVRPIRNALASA